MFTGMSAALFLCAELHSSGTGLSDYRTGHHRTK